MQRNVDYATASGWPFGVAGEEKKITADNKLCFQGNTKLTLCP